MRKQLLFRAVAAALLSATAAAIPVVTATPASAQDLNPANPNSPNSPYNLFNQYGYGAANPTIVGLAFWTGQPYSQWACRLGVDFQCPSSPNYAHRRRAVAPAADNVADAAPVRHRHKRRHRY